MSAQCRAEGCDREARYRSAGLCQKHYFRLRRTGSTERQQRKAVYRRSNPAGYQLLHEPGHPLAGGNGYVYEHRMVIYSVYGDDLPPCAICGKQVTWADCHIDHIDNDVTNNARENLRQTCRGCNVKRGRLPACEYEANTKLTIDGVSMTAHEWARQPGVNVCGNTIRRRKANGASDYDAVFGRKLTHTGHQQQRPEPHGALAT